MTYENKITELIQTINSVYNDAEWLRDVADEDEKQYWNQLRGKLYDAADPLQKLRRTMKDERREMTV